MKQGMRGRKRGARAVPGRCADLRANHMINLAQQRNGNGNSKPHAANGNGAGTNAPAAPAETSEARAFKSEAKNDGVGLTSQDLAELDSGIEANGILEVMPDGFGFIRCEKFSAGGE